MFKLMIFIVKFIIGTILRIIWSLIGSALILVALGKVGELWDKLKVRFKEWMRKEIREALAE